MYDKEGVSDYPAEWVAVTGAYDAVDREWKEGSKEKGLFRCEGQEKVKVRAKSVTGVTGVYSSPLGSQSPSSQYWLSTTWDSRWDMTSHAHNLKTQKEELALWGCWPSIYSTHMPGSKPSWLVPTCLSPLEYFRYALPSVEEPGTSLHGSAWVPSAAQGREVALSCWCQALIFPALQQSM